MKIALLTSEFVTEKGFDGGLANYTYKIAKTLIKLDHYPIVIVSSNRNESFYYEDIRVERVCTWINNDWNPTNKFWNKLDRFLKYKYHMSFNLIWQSFKLNQRLRHINLIEKIDIVQYAHLGGIGLFKPFSLPAVARISSSTKLCQEAGGYGEADSQIRQQEFFEYLSLKRMSGIFGPSEKIAKYISNEINKKIEIIESPFFNGVTEYNSEIYNEYLKNKKYILFFGTLSRIKGVHIIAEIIYSFLSKYENFNFVFVGKQSFFNNDKTILEFVYEKSLECKERVIYLNSLKHEYLYPIIENAQFVILPSIIDNFPNTCIEAMAHRKIVIGTYGNGFDQLINNNQSGFLIPKGDPVELLNVIEKVMSLDAEKRKAIEENAFKRIEMLKPEIIGQNMIDYYQSFIKKRNVRNYRVN